MKGFVYFAQMKTGPIKIGFTIDVDRRLSQIKVGVPDGVTLLASAPGSPAIEGWLHRQFIRLNMSGEWYRPERDLLDFIRRVDLIGSTAFPVELISDALERPSRIEIDDELRARVAFYLKGIAEPVRAGEGIKAQIVRAADRIGMHRSRAKDIWYGDARSISAAEYLVIKELYDAKIAATMRTSQIVDAL